MNFSGVHDSTNKIFLILAETRSCLQGNRQQDFHEALRLFVNFLVAAKPDQITAHFKKIAFTQLHSHHFIFFQRRVKESNSKVRLL